jgi:hypothetical protein
MCVRLGCWWWPRCPFRLQIIGIFSFPPSPKGAAIGRKISCFLSLFFFLFCDVSAPWPPLYIVPCPRLIWMRELCKGRPIVSTTGRARVYSFPFFFIGFVTSSRLLITTDHGQNKNKGNRRGDAVDRQDIHHLAQRKICEGSGMIGTAGSPARALAKKWN